MPMTPSSEKNAASRKEHPHEFDLERFSQLISDLERDLANAPQDIPHLQELRSELGEFQRTLASGKTEQGPLREHLHAIREALQRMTATVEGEVLLDTPYITEAGRILGLV